MVYLIQLPNMEALLMPKLVYFWILYMVVLSIWGVDQINTLSLLPMTLVELSTVVLVTTN